MAVPTRSQEYSERIGIDLRITEDCPIGFGNAGRPEWMNQGAAPGGRRGGPDYDQNCLEDRIPFAHLPTSCLRYAIMFDRSAGSFSRKAMSLSGMTLSVSVSHRSSVESSQVTHVFFIASE